MKKSVFTLIISTFISGIFLINAQEKVSDNLNPELKWTSDVGATKSGE